MASSHRFLDSLILIAMLSFGAPTFAEEDCTEKKRTVFQELGLKDSKSKPQLLDCSWIRDAFTMLKSPRIPISSWEYEGGFRLTTKATSDNAKATIDFSLGIFSLSASKKSIFVASHPQFGGVGEISIPPIVASKDIEDFEVGTYVLQGFQSINNTPRVSTGIAGYFRITGIKQIDDALMVNYINWYDANGTETDTSIMIWQANNLANSKMYGPYQLEGAAHAAGWLSEIPHELQALFEATHITGSQSNASIASRLSIGPTAFAFNPRKSVVYGPPGSVETETLLDFSMRQPLFDHSVYKLQPDYRSLSLNSDGRNKMWTLSSGASFGFIVPGTRTYLTLGKSAGHESGIGYKIKQSNGHQCGGPCPFDADDYYSYYWAWDIADLLRVKLGLALPHSLQPYEHGKFPLPTSFKGLAIGGADYDEEQRKLYISLTKGDTLGKYARPPLFLTYKLKATTENAESK